MHSETVPRDRAQALRRLGQGSTDPGSQPTRAALVAALEAWPTDLEIVTQATHALIQMAARRPRDEPALQDGPAELVLGALARLEESWDGAAPWPVELVMRRACALSRVAVDRDADAQQAFERARAAAPADAELAIEHARFHAWRGRFEPALEAARDAAALAPESRQAQSLRATYATALGRGAEAVEAWLALGLPAHVRAGSGMPEVEGLPAARVRVPARGGAPLGLSHLPENAAAFELLSVAPLSPAHGVIQSASLLDAVVDYGDVVLWEPVPVAVTQAQGQSVPCFPLLEVLRRGDELRLRILILSPADDGDVEARIHRALADSARLAIHMRRSSGRQQLLLGKLLVPAGAAGSGLIDALTTLGSTESLAISCPGLYERFADSARAGKEHKAWLALERRAERHGLLPRVEAEESKP